MIFLDQPRDFRLRDLAPNVSLGRINQELRHAQKIDILQADGEAPIARPLPNLWVRVIFELGKDIPCGFRRTYSFILSCHTQTRSSLSNDIHTHFWNVPFQYIARKGAICRFAVHSSFALWGVVYQKLNHQTTSQWPTLFAPTRTIFPCFLSSVILRLIVASETPNILPYSP